MTKIILPLAGAFCVLPMVSSSTALLLGFFFALVLKNPYASITQKVTPRLLQLSVIGLGAGMNLEVVAKVGMHGMGYTAIGIALTTLVGLALGRFLNVGRDVSVLVTTGTAICGGSAIAAVASTIRSKAPETSVALATVFFLNAMALFIFPALGRYFDLSDAQFGLWGAMAIHDTSSVVGSALSFGGRAVDVATTVKLARALWIIPVCMAVGVFYRTSDSKPARPWFILGFIAISALVTWVPALRAPGKVVYALASRSLVVTLFLIGANLSRESLKQVGMRPLLQGIILWAFVAIGTMLAIQLGWIGIELPEVAGGANQLSW